MAMKEWFKIKMATIFGGKKDDFKRNNKARALANRYDVDDDPNEPSDFATPPTRLPEDPKERGRLLSLMKGMRGMGKA